MATPLTDSLGYGVAPVTSSNYGTWTTPENLTDGDDSTGSERTQTVVNTGTYSSAIAITPPVEEGGSVRFDSITLAGWRTDDTWATVVSVDNSPVAGEWTETDDDGWDIDFFTGSARTWRPSGDSPVGLEIAISFSETHSGYHYVGFIDIHEVLLRGEILPPPPQPVGVWADWDGDGFGEIGSDDDLTSDMASWTITRGASAEITGGAQPGTATVILNSPADDRYNPLHADGPLAGHLTDGVPFWIGVNADGALAGHDPRGLFGGRIKDITPLVASGTDVAPQVEITCEDALSWLGRTSVGLADGLYLTHAEIRDAILATAGETRTDLPHETTTVPIAGWDGSALSALEALNAANGSRHFAKPEDVRDDWYTYTCRNRQWRLDATVDASVDDASGGTDAQRGITGSSGWRLSADTVINQQKATVTPITWTSGQVTVWECSPLPFTIVAGERVFWIAYDDYVDDPVPDINYTGTAPTVSLLSFGTTAKLTVESAGSTTVTGLSIEGRLARRGTAESVVVDDTASQAGFRGVRAGSEISGEWVGVLASARGLAAHIVWRYGTTQYRPTMTVEDWMPYQFEVDLFDVLSVTIAQLGMTNRLFEVVGLTHEPVDIPVHRTTFVLQECRVQTDPGWFILDTSLLDDDDILAY